MKDMEGKFDADQVLMERNFHSTLLKSTDVAFERGRQAMVSLYSEAAHELDGRKGVFLPDWEVLLRRVNVLEQRKANLHAQQREELRQEALRSRSGIRSATHPASPTYVPADPLEGEAGEEQVNDDVANEEEDS